MLTIRKLAFAGVSLLAVASPAYAQDVAANPSDEAAVEGGEILVTARRRDESVQDIPAVVNPVTAEAIDKLNIRRLEDVSSVVPGLTLTPNTNGIGSVTQMRGVQYDVIASGDNGTVQYYFNDAPVSSGVVLGGLFDVAMIEVLRGPQGTLKGRASPSGAISMTYRKADLNEAGGYAAGTVNNRDGYNVNGAINVPIVEGKLGVRVAGLVSDDDGNRVRPISGSYDLMNRTRAGRVSVGANPFDGVFKIDASYTTLNMDSSQYSQVESVSNVVGGATLSPVTIGAKDRLAVNRMPLENHVNFKNYNVNSQLALAGQKLVYVGNWTKQKFEGFDPSRSGDRAGLFANPYGLPMNLSGGIISMNPIGFTQENHSRADNQTHEIRLQNEERIAGMFDYVVGYLNYKIDSETNFKETVTGVTNPAGNLVGVMLMPLQRFNHSTENSVFGNITAHIGDRAELSGGLRHIWYKSNAGVRGDCGDAFATCVNNPALAARGDFEHTIFSVSGKYEITDDVMGYVSYGTSWRPNTVVIGGPTAPTELQKEFLGSAPETSKSLEAGIKSSWLDRRLRLNVSAYYQKFKNSPYRAPGSGVYAVNVAANTVRSYNFIAAVPIEVKGVEADVSFDVTRNWNIGANVAYANGKIKNGRIPCLDLDGNGVADVVTSTPTVGEINGATNGQGVSACNVTQRANGSSPWDFSVQSEYKHALTDNVDGFLRGLYTWKGNTIGDPQNAYDSVKSYGLLNLYLGVRDADGGWEITAYGKNITNSFRVLSRTNGAEFTTVNGTANSSTNYFGITTTQPREFGLTARIAFGSR